jgi:hypothetical protein
MPPRRTDRALTGPIYKKKSHRKTISPVMSGQPAMSCASSAEPLPESPLALHNALKELYEILTEALENDPPPKVRKTLWQLAREALRHW